MNMARRILRNKGLTFLKGILLGVCLFLVFYEFDQIFPLGLSDVIFFPSTALASLWHQAGLPPEGEAGIVFPVFVFAFGQCCAMGWVLAWLLEPRKREQPPAEHK